MALYAILLVFLTALSAPIWAHPPYEVSAGSMVRTDGTTVNMVKCYRDGIIGDDYGCVQFRLQDGSVIAETEYSPDEIILRPAGAKIDIFRYPSHWIPIANRVQRFDGQTISGSTGDEKLARSVWLHTRAHLTQYLYCLIFASFIWAAWIAVSLIPNKGGLAALRVCSFLAISLIAFLFAIVIMWIGPVSPLILTFFGAIFLFAFHLLRKVFLNKLSAQTTSS